MRFGDVVSNSKEAVKDPAASGLDRVVALEHMDPGNLQLSGWQDAADGTTFTRCFRAGQTLFAKRRAYQRKVAYAQFDGVCSGDILAFEARPDELLPELLPFIVQSDAFFEHALRTSAGSLSPRTKWQDLARWEFDLPPLEQQRPMAELLWSFKRALDAQQSRLEAVDTTIGRFCADLYSRSSGLGLDRPMPDVGDIRMGRQKAPKYMRGVTPRPYLTVLSVGHLELDVRDLPQMDFSESELQIYRVLPGDILLTEGDLISPLNVGRPVLVADDLQDCCFQNTLIRLRLKDDVLPLFALGMLEGMRLGGVFASAASTTTVTHLGLKRFSALRMPVPALERQAGVAKQLECLLETRRALRSSRVALEAMAASVREELIV